MKVHAFVPEESVGEAVFVLLVFLKGETIAFLFKMFSVRESIPFGRELSVGKTVFVLLVF